MSTLTIDANQLLDVQGRPVGLTPSQKRLIGSTAPFVTFQGGFGSGKTFAGALKGGFFNSMYHGAGYAGLIVSPTYVMLQQAVIPTLRDGILRQLGDPERGQSLWDLSKYHKQDQELILPNGHLIYFRSADKPERIRGTNLAWMWVDEAQEVKNFPELWISGMSRLRKARNDHTQMIVTGTPERKDDVYRRWVEGPDEDDPEAREKWRRDFEVIRASSRENPGLPPEFIENILATVPPQLIPAYLDGQHIDDALGLCYYNFRRKTNVNPAAIYDRTLDLHISWDFGVDPMAMSIHQVRGGSHLVTIDEIGLRNANTPAVCLEFIRRYGRQGENHTRGITIYGDASDKVGISNYDEIEDYLRHHFVGKIKRKVPNSNPMHARRIKSVNALFRNAQGVVRYWIHPKCKGLLRDLENQAFAKGTRSTTSVVSKDKKQKMDDGTTLGHYSDTLDYIVDWLFPFRRQQASAYIRNQRSTMTAHF